MSAKRKGSILFTSVSMVAIFLTLVVASTAYIQSSTAASLNDRFRDTAEQAARSGVEWVLGYAQQNIDTESRLPREWSRLQDGDIINPVADYLVPAGVTICDDLNASTSTTKPDVGRMLGTSSAGIASAGTYPAGVGEFILSIQGDYVVTFKARIQQYAFAESIPRQYRLGVIGRVRKRNHKGTLSVNANEKQSLIAESFIMSNIGQVPTSRYAALIDIDGVKNWVPGEVVNGPVHVNRGYVDSLQETLTGAAGGTALRDDPVTDMYGTNITLIGPDGTNTATQTRAIRSTINLRTSANSPFAAVTDAENGTLTTPRFNDEVSMTIVNAADSTSSTYQMWDNYNAATGTAKGADEGVGLLVDGHPYTAANIDTTTQQAIFKAPENRRKEAHFNAGGTDVAAAPTILKQPISLPPSVRNRLRAVVGAPLGLGNYSWWPNLKDGVYVPTSKFWVDQAASGTTVPTTYSNSAASPDDAYPTGGVYIRGNVEIMRMGVMGTFSYYMFQVGYGSGTGYTTAVGGANNHRTYLYVVNRDTSVTGKESWLMAFSTLETDFVPGIGKSATGPATLASIIGAPPIAGNDFGGTVAFTGGVGGGFGNTDIPEEFTLNGPNCTLRRCHHFSRGYASRAFPFNGVVFVDLSQFDRARDITNPNAFTNYPPITGNIFALGDPGTFNSVTKRTLDAAAQERVATYQDSNISGTASSLTIMATGNIFIQNDLALNSLAAVTNFPGFHFVDAATVTINSSRDLLGLVADKQVVLGLAAPSTTTRENTGVAVHAAIASLGDPAYNYVSQQADPAFMIGNAAYRGSFTTEGLMQYYNLSEDYQVCNGGPTILFSAVGDPPTLKYGGAAWPGTQANSPTSAAGCPVFRTSTALGVDSPDANGYPGIPTYMDGMLKLPVKAFLQNPNGTATRGRAVVFGSVTVKKRGIIGKGDTSYDKRFLFDRRLLTIAPPVFPSSTNIITRTAAPITPQGLTYASGGSNNTAVASQYTVYDFMRTP